LSAELVYGKAKPHSKNHFVGRDKELTFLHNVLNHTIENKTSKIIFIRGEYGIGKSALVNHFVEEAKHKNPAIAFAKGSCTMETEESGLVPFIQIIFSLANESAQRKIIRGDVWDFFKKVAPAWLDILTLGLASPITTTVEEGRKLFATSKTTNFSPENVFIQFSNSVYSLAKRQPILIFIDDIHWADQSTLRLLFHFAHYLGNQAAIQGVIIIVAYRPVEAEYTSTNSSLFREVRANLLRMDAVELNIDKGINVSEYISRRYPNHRYSSEAIERIQSITEGYPLLVDQLLSWWEESNVVVSSTVGGQVEWTFANIPNFSEIPKSVAVILEARLRLLSEDLQAILDCTSVEGEEFTAQTIRTLLDFDESAASLHPGVVNSCPSSQPALAQKRIILQGETPNPIDLPTGCRFHPRCPVAIGACKQTDPPLFSVSESHQAACLLVIK
jgi:oligopeptide/dipeptide ABC transporter ATP-binding protein